MDAPHRQWYLVKTSQDFDIMEVSRDLFKSKGGKKDNLSFFFFFKGLDVAVRCRFVDWYSVVAMIQPGMDAHNDHEMHAFYVGQRKLSSFLN